MSNTFEAREMGAYDRRPGQVDVEPSDLAHFARMLAGDIEEFRQTREAVDHTYLSQPVPMHVFAGHAGDAGGMPEARAFHRAYHELEAAMRKMLLEIESGLSILKLGSELVHTAYETADMFGAESVGKPFQFYDSEHIERVFNSTDEFDPEALADTGLADDHMPQIQDDWDAIVDREAERADLQDLEADGNLNVDTPARPEPEVHAHNRFEHATASINDGQIQLHLPTGPRSTESPPHPMVEEVTE